MTDQPVTPPEIPSDQALVVQPAAPEPQPEPISRRSWEYRLLWAVALTSLALNLILIYGLVNGLSLLRGNASRAVGNAQNTVRELRAATLEYTVQIDQSIPINVDVPIQQTVTLPINTTLPVDTRVQVPIDIPLLGTRTIEVPLRATIPVSLTVQVPLNMTVPLAANVPIQLAVPIRIVVANSPVDRWLVSVQNSLDDLQTSLRALTPGRLFEPAPTEAP